MRVSARSARGLALLATLAPLLGCSELQARRHAREGNRLYREGDYGAAVAAYGLAEEHRTDLPTVAFNKGLACRQLMVPGARSAENERAVDCALDAFSRLTRLRPDDPRGEQLFTQTLFDADRFDKLAAIYQEKLRARPDDLPSIQALIQVYSRWNRWQEALKWTVRSAELQPRNAEVQYGVGVFIWNLLFQKGGGNDKSAYDPRSPTPGQSPPAFAPGEIQGEQRVALADQGIAHLEKALAQRPKYREAMAYVNLLHRQKSFAFFDRPSEWQACIDAAESWRQKAMRTEPAPKASAR